MRYDRDGEIALTSEGREVTFSGHSFSSNAGYGCSFSAADDITVVGNTFHLSEKLSRYISKRTQEGLTWGQAFDEFMHES